MRRLLPVVVIALVACSSTQRLSPDDIRPLYNSNATRVKGLREGLSQSRDTPVRVLVLHGMITNTRGYSRTLQRNIGTRLSLTRGETGTPFDIERGYDVTVFAGPQPLSTRTALPLSSIQKTSWRDGGGKERLVFYEVLWSPLRDVVKNRFLACFEAGVEADECLPPGNVRPNPDRQVFVNRALKNGLLVGGFADAAIVLGPVGDVLRDDVSQAMCIIGADVLGRPAGAGKRCDFNVVAGDQPAASNERLGRAEFFALTHSLGSFLLFSAQEEFALHRAQDDADVARETSAFYLLDDATVFMRANQISLLQLGRLRAECNGPCPNRLLSNIADQQANGLGQMTAYVAFNDKNDLLGFEVPPYLAEPGLVGTLVNVSVRNPGWRIPGLLKSPAGAHVSSDDNPAVIEAIVEGFALPPS